LIWRWTERKKMPTDGEELEAERETERKRKRREGERKRRMFGHVD